MKDLIQKILMWFVVRFSSHFRVKSECGKYEHDFKICPHCGKGVIINPEDSKTKCWSCKKVICSHSGQGTHYLAHCSYYTTRDGERIMFHLDQKSHRHLIWRSLVLTPIIIYLLITLLFDFSLNGYVFGIDEGLNSMTESVFSYSNTNGVSLYVFSLGIVSIIFVFFICIIGIKKLRFTKSSPDIEIWSFCIVPAWSLLLISVFFAITKPAIVPIWSNDFTKIMTRVEAVEYVNKKALAEMEMLIADSKWEEAKELVGNMWSLTWRDDKLANLWTGRKNELVRTAVLTDFSSVQFFYNDLRGLFSDSMLMGMLVRYLQTANDSEVFRYCNSSFWGITTPFTLAQDYSKPLLNICRTQTGNQLILGK